MTPQLLHLEACSLLERKISGFFVSSPGTLEDSSPLSRPVCALETSISSWAPRGSPKLPDSERWTLIPDFPGSAKVARGPRPHVKHAVYARLGATTFVPSVATVRYRGWTVSIQKLHHEQHHEQHRKLWLECGLFVIVQRLETKTMFHRPSLESANSEILLRLSQITSMLEDIKQDNDSTISSSRSLKGAFLELSMPHSSPPADSVQGKHTLRGNDAEEQAYGHDPLTLYAANSPEYMLRWPIFSKVVTDAEKHTRSFLLDSLDNQDQSKFPPLRQAGTGSLLDNIQILVRKYLHLVHRRNPVVDAEKLKRYAREVTVQGLGWDGPSCQVVRSIHANRQLASHANCATSYLHAL